MRFTPTAPSTSLSAPIAATQNRPVWGGDASAPVMDHVAEEAPISLQYNGDPHVVMMATPEHLADLGRGFSVTEDIVDQVGDITALDVRGPAAETGSVGYVVDMRIPAAHVARLAQRQRNLQGRTGCGMCGARTVGDAIRPPRHVAAGIFIDPGAIRNAVAALAGQQPINALTGATHAAAWADCSGRMLAVREDVGRHNALDKLVGHLLLDGTDVRDGFCVITSRASYEMVHKSAAVGIALLVAISAPTAYAVRIAEEAGMTLIGFARGDRQVVYSCPARLQAMERSA